MDFSSLQAALERQAILMICLYTVALIVTTWASYEILKAAIKNGIDGSVLGTRRSAPTPQTPVAPAGYRWVLVKDDKPNSEMRAER